MGLPARPGMADPPPPLRLIRPGPDLPSRRQVLAGRAKSAIWWGLALLALLQLGVGLAFFARHPGRSDPEYWARLERIRSRTGPAAGNPLTLFIFGSSRPQLGLRACLLEPLLSAELHRPVVAMNFAVSGGGPLTELFAWRRLERDGVRPDRVLIEVHPALLNACYPPGWELKEAIWPLYRLSWSDLAFVERHAGATRPGLRGAWVRSAAGSLHHERVRVVSELAPQLLPFGFRLVAADLDPSGQVRLEDQPLKPEDRVPALAKARREYELGLQSFRPGPGYEHLRELLTACREDGIPAALFVMPEGPVFRSWYGPGAWQAVQKCLDELAADFGVPVLNTREWVGEDGFTDSHHLNFTGATRYTERFSAEKLAPWMREPRAERTGPLATR